MRSTLRSVEAELASGEHSAPHQDIIELDMTTEDGLFDTALVRRGMEKPKELSDEYARYINEKGNNRVVPLLVLQVMQEP